MIQLFLSLAWIGGLVVLSFLGYCAYYRIRSETQEKFLAKLEDRKYKSDLRDEIWYALGKYNVVEYLMMKLTVAFRPIFFNLFNLREK